MTATAKQVRKVQRRLLEAAYGASFTMLIQTTQLSSHLLLDALELCEKEHDPAARVLQLWQDWRGTTDYRTFPEYVRWRTSAAMMTP